MKTIRLVACLALIATAFYVGFRSPDQVYQDPIRTSSSAVSKEQTVVEKPHSEKVTVTISLDTETR